MSPDDLLDELAARLDPGRCHRGRHVRQARAEGRRPGVRLPQGRRPRVPPRRRHGRTTARRSTCPAPGCSTRPATGGRSRTGCAVPGRAGRRSGPGSARTRARAASRHDRGHVAVISMGGTIAMAPSASGGIVPSLGADDLVASVPGLAELDVKITTESLRSLPSPSLGFADLVALSGRRAGRAGRRRDRRRDHPRHGHHRGDRVLPRPHRPRRRARRGHRRHAPPAGRRPGRPGEPVRGDPGRAVPGRPRARLRSS